MGQFLNAAYRVLKRSHEPLTPIEIVEKAIELGLLTTHGKTPHQTMKSKLSTDILKRRDLSLFKRTGAGKFGLREWDNTEYHALRSTKSLFDEQIVVIKRNLLGDLVRGSGLSAARSEQETYDLIKQNYRLLKRRTAEENHDVVQLVSAFLVKHRNRYLTFKRSKRLPESRLHGFYSILFGGHLTTLDVMPLLPVFDAFRELQEELKLDYKPLITFRGLLYDESVAVSQIHLGLVYDVQLQGSKYIIGEKGFLMDPKFEDLASILGRIDDFENWSQIIIREEAR